MKIKIIAEVAQGYMGNSQFVREYIKISKNISADILKFQLIYADELATKNYEYYKLFKSLEISNKEWVQLIKFANKSKVTLAFDIFGPKSLNLAIENNINYIKVHQMDMENYSFLKQISKSKIQNIILGISGSNLSTLKKVKNILNEKNLIFIYGHQNYPTDNYKMQLSKINYLQNLNTFKESLFGYADHSEDFIDSLLFSTLAIGQNINYIEKHLTFNKISKYEDYESAINPDEFKNYASKLKKLSQVVENILTYKVTSEEDKYKKNIQRVVVATKDIKKNSVFNKNNIALKRNKSFKFFDKNLEYFFNKKSKIDIKKNENITKKHIKL